MKKLFKKKEKDIANPPPPAAPFEMSTSGDETYTNEAMTYAPVPLESPGGHQPAGYQFPVSRFH